MSTGPDFPINIRPDDFSISLAGELLITGAAAEKVRRLLATVPEAYPAGLVPFLRSREPSFSPEELWIDQHGRIHITNANLVRRMRRHLPAATGAAPKKAEG